MVLVDVVVVVVVNAIWFFVQMWQTSSCITKLVSRNLILQDEKFIKFLKDPPYLIIIVFGGTLE